MKTQLKTISQLVNLKISQFIFIGIFANLLIGTFASAQNIGINTTGAVPNSSALLDVDDGTNNNVGVLIPRIALTDVATYAPITGSSTASLVVYNTNASVTNGNGAGYYYWSGTKWLAIPAPTNGPGTSGQVLTSQGSGNPPQWSTLSSGGGGPTGCASCITSISNYEGSSLTWAQCREACRNLTEGGFSDWRMPTWDEAAYYGSGAFDPPDGSWINNWVWTANPWDSRFASPPVTGIWVVFNESNGNWSGFNHGASNACRCVR